MQLSDFTEVARKHLTQVHVGEGYWAFVPPPLPPRVEINIDITNCLSSADRALGELAGTGRMLPNPHLLISPFIRREAVLSSRIENTLTSLSDLFRFEAAPTAKPDILDVKEVHNYVRALEFGLDRLKDIPVCLRLIRELHGILLEDARGKGAACGEFRKSQNWIGPPNTRLEDATYVPPPVDGMKQALDDFEKYLHAESKLPPLIRLAIIHYQFEAIHPFLDGNGRIGRLLITLLLCEWGLLPQPLLYLSAFFEKHRKEYYDLLVNVSRAERWSEWIEFFLRGVAEQASDAVERSRQLLDLWQSYRQKMQRTRSSALLLKLVDELFKYPLVTIPFTSNVLNCTYVTARNNIGKLVSAEILREMPGMHAKRKIYIADEILKIFEEI